MAEYRLLTNHTVRRVITVLLAVALSSPNGAVAQRAQIAEEGIDILFTYAGRLGRFLLDYGAGKVLDKALGDKLRGEGEEKLKRFAEETKKRLRFEVGERHQLEERLRVAESELRILREVKLPGFSALSLPRLQQELALDRLIMSKQKQVLGVIQDTTLRVPTPEVMPQPSLVPTPPPWMLPLPRVTPQPSLSGSVVVVHATGRGSRVLLEEGSEAQPGRVFELSRDGAVATYRLGPTQNALIELRAPGTIIFIPSRMRDRVLVLPIPLSLEYDIVPY